VLVDLSQTVSDGLVTYPGLPAAHVCDFMTREESRSKYAPGTEFHIAKIEMVSNTGTYVDAPFHRYADGRDLSQLPLEAVADLPGLVVRSSARAVDADAFTGLDVRGHAVLVCTGWSRHFGTPQYGDGSPFLTEAAAKVLRDGGAALVGVDALNIDDTRGNTRPVHSTLLRADVLVCEHLTNLAQLPAKGFRFSAVPVKVKGVGTFPVRAFAAL
jgi:kynurenine formamidase